MVVEVVVTWSVGLYLPEVEDFTIVLCACGVGGRFLVLRQVARAPGYKSDGTYLILGAGARPLFSFLEAVIIENYRF